MKRILIAFLLISSVSFGFEPVKNASATYCSSVLSECFAPGETKRFPAACVLASPGTFLVEIHVMNPQLGVPDLPTKIIVKVNGEVAIELPFNMTVDEAKIEVLSYARTFAAGDRVEIFGVNSLGHPINIALWYQLVPVPPGEE